MSLAQEEFLIITKIRLMVINNNESSKTCKVLFLIRLLQQACSTVSSNFPYLVSQKMFSKLYSQVCTILKK